MFERDGDTETDNRRERLRFWLTIGMATVMTGVVAALVLLLARANADYDRSLGWQTQSLEVISQTRSLDASLARAEAALGRFAVGLQKEDGRVFQQQWGLARQYLTQLQRNVRDNPAQTKLVAQLTEEANRRGSQLGDAALSANYRQTVAAISKYHAAGHDAGLGRIEGLLTQIIGNERALLRDRNRIAAADRANLNHAPSCARRVGAAWRAMGCSHLARAAGLAACWRTGGGLGRRRRCRCWTGRRSMPARQLDGRQYRAAQRDGRAAGRRSPVAAGPKDGSGRPTDRRHRA